MTLQEASADMTEGGVSKPSLGRSATASVALGLLMQHCYPPEQLFLPLEIVGILQARMAQHLERHIWKEYSEPAWFVYEKR